jgi:TIGR03009 family protein
MALSAVVQICEVNALPPLTAPKAKPADEQQKRLDEVLDKWEVNMQATTGLHVELERVEKDKVFKTEAKFVGSLDTLTVENESKVEHLWRLETAKAGTTELHEKLVCDGRVVYQFAPIDQKIYTWAIPKAKPAEVKKDNSLFGFFHIDLTQIFQDNICSLVLFAKTAELRKRYDLKFSDDKNHPSGEDMHYIYVKIEPRGVSDGADFEHAEVVLNKDNFLPCRLWFQCPNKTEITWSVTSLDDKAKLKREDFGEPSVPTGWKLVPVDTSK